MAIESQQSGTHSSVTSEGGFSMKKNLSIFVLLVILLSATACAFPFVIRSRDDAVKDSVSETVQALIEQTQAAATYTPLPTLTLQPTYTYYPTSHPYYRPQPTAKPCNQAVLVSETIKDGTKFTAGESIEKSWRLENIGTCTWSKDYQLVFDSGDRMSGPKSQDIDETVRPGETVDIIIDLEAPDEVDTYKGYWRLATDDDYEFATVWAQIKVVTEFAVTSVLPDDPHRGRGYYFLLIRQGNI